MLTRFGLLVHWITFLAQLLIIVSLFFVDDWNDYFPDLLQMITDPIGGRFEPYPVVLAIALFGWHLKWLLTGDKALFPWDGNKNKN